MPIRHKKCVRRHRPSFIKHVALPLRGFNRHHNLNSWKHLKDKALLNYFLIIFILILLFLRLSCTDYSRWKNWKIYCFVFISKHLLTVYELHLEVSTAKRKLPGTFPKRSTKADGILIIFFRIQAPLGKQVRITFPEFKIDNCGAAGLKIYDGLAKTENFQIEHCGSQRPSPFTAQDSLITINVSFKCFFFWFSAKTLALRAPNNNMKLSDF